jgi:hypothetical protein
MSDEEQKAIEELVNKKTKSNKKVAQFKGKKKKAKGTKVVHGPVTKLLKEIGELVE